MDKEISVVHKKIPKDYKNRDPKGKPNVYYGEAYYLENLAVIDKRLYGKQHLGTLIHEIMHLQNPDWSENKVTRLAKQMTNLIWEFEYRRVDNRTKQESY